MPIIDNDFIVADRAFDDDSRIEFETKIGDIDAVIISLVQQVEHFKKRANALDTAVGEEIDNRDAWEERATSLAGSVGEYFGADIGEHSSANCPIKNAHELLNQI